MRTLTGHSGGVGQVTFSGDGAQVFSAGNDGTVGIWDVASGRQVHQLVGNKFALVEGVSGMHKRHRHVITAHGVMLQIYECAEEQEHTEGGAAAAPVAFFKAPQRIVRVQCFGAVICVGCWEGAVCILSAPFLTA